jgi:hypothetical protein
MKALSSEFAQAVIAGADTKYLKSQHFHAYRVNVNIAKCPNPSAHSSPRAKNKSMELITHIATVNNNDCCQHEIVLGHYLYKYRHAPYVRTWVTVTRQQHRHCREYPPRPIVIFTDSEIHNNIKQKTICTRRDS